MSQKNIKNLEKRVTFGDMPVAKQLEIARKGGQAQKERWTIKRALKDALAMQISDKQLIARLDKAGIPSDITNAQAVVVAMVQAAQDPKNRNMPAAQKQIVELMGEHAAQKIELTITPPLEDQARRIEAVMAARMAEPAGYTIADVDTDAGEQAAAQARDIYQREESGAGETGAVATERHDDEEQEHDVRFSDNEGGE